MLKVEYHSKFKKDFQRVLKRGLDPEKLHEVIMILSNERPLPDKYKDHSLEGNYKGYRECHIQPDWLLIYKIDKDRLVLVAARTGTHSDLF